MVHGVKVEFFDDNTYRIHTASLAVGNKVVNYLVEQGIFEVREPVREGDEWKTE
jgi:hypothetical protein